MELTNKRTQYSVKNVINDIVLLGEVMLNNDDKVTSLTGSFNSSDNSYLGDFYYTVSADGRINKNISNLSVEIEDTASGMFEETISEVKRLTTK